MTFVKSRSGRPLIGKLVGDASLSAGSDIVLAAPPDALHLFDADGMALPQLVTA